MTQQGQQRFLFDVSWEVCNMVGGIYTVLASKLSQVKARYGDNYVAIGPNVSRMVEDRHTFDEDIWEPALLETLTGSDVRVRMGRWLVPGEPRCLLVDYSGLYARKNEILARLWEQYQLESLFGSWDYYDPLLFAHAAGIVVERYAMNILLPKRQEAVVHAHEWMSSAALLYLRERLPEVGGVFTTHATTLGRALAANRADPRMYKTLSQQVPDQLARELGVTSKHSMERVSARAADCFTTVSSITALECEFLLEKKPDLLLPNGLGDRFPPRAFGSASARSAARKRLLRLARATTGSDYPADDTTLILSSGRYEYTNKGLDVFLRAIARLRSKLDGGPGGHRVVAFVACPADHAGPVRAVQQADRIGGVPDRVYTSTHDLRQPETDPIQRDLAELRLTDGANTNVHVIQIPIYLDGSDPLITQSYYELLGGFDVTAFPSFYEPWGYTPPESLAFGVPTVTSDLAGFGRWALEHGHGTLAGAANSVDSPPTSRRLGSAGAWRSGCVVLARDAVARDEVAENLAESLAAFLQVSPKEREQIRESCLAIAREVHWSRFGAAYDAAHEMAFGAAATRRLHMPTARFTELAEQRVATVTPTGDAVGSHLRAFMVHNVIPEALAPLRELSQNLWWHWHPDATDLFREIDPDLWRDLRGAAPAFLEQSPQARLKAVASSPEYLARLERVHARFKAETARNPSDPVDIAYFCMEYGLAGHLHIYAGGLGVLAGDHLKTASDLGLRLTAVGLAYRDGYFRQRLDATGNQEAAPDVNEWSALGTERVLNAQGAPVTVSVAFPGRRVHVRAYRVNVGRIELFLLDTDHETNSKEDRAITSNLYGGDATRRLQQEIVLGVGGELMLRELGINATIFHMNEGHSAFLILARLAFLIREAGLKFDEALDYVRHTTVFTTHTPVPAGHDRFDEHIARPYLAPFERELHVDASALARLGCPRGKGEGGVFSTTHLALHGSLHVNGVSALHGAVSRRMFQAEFPDYHEGEVPIGHVTNGVHVSTWAGPETQALFAEAVGADWRERLAEPTCWERVRALPDARVWRAHREQRARLVEWLDETLQEQWRKHGYSSALGEVLNALKADALLVSFARRFAPYKRASLLFQDIERLGRLLRAPGRPVILLFAGKAHPHDRAGQLLLQDVYATFGTPQLAGRGVFLENYGIEMARLLVGGSDVWLNTPSRPMEASGTSGMKAAINGCLNLSVADGWWAEGYDGENGWVIGAPEGDLSPGRQDDDAPALYSLLERSLVPTYFDRNADGVPEAWVQRMKDSIASIVPRFSTHRMLADYQRLLYGPALASSKTLSDDDFEGLRELRTRKRAILEHWTNVSFKDVRVMGIDTDRISVGQVLPVRAELTHPGLGPELLDVQIVIAEGVSGEDMGELSAVPMRVVASSGDGQSSWAADFTCPNPGPHAVGIRILPREFHGQGDVAADVALVRWLAGPTKARAGG